MQEQVEVCCIVREIYNGVFEAPSFMLIPIFGAGCGKSQQEMYAHLFFLRFLNSTLLRFENSQLVSSRQFIIILRFLENL